MAYDDILAERIRRVVADVDGEVTERKMFGGLAFLVNGNMFVGVVGDDLMVRLGKAGADAALRRAHVREMDFTGRPMKTMVYVEAEGLRGDALDDWVVAAASFALGPPSERG
jgi:TfoX/Sxy family transcriptional regulator of competence genes